MSKTCLYLFVVKPENIFRGEEGAALLAPVPLGLHDVQVEGVGVPRRKTKTYQSGNNPYLS
jgi:hypothetical protein